MTGICELLDYAQKRGLSVGICKYIDTCKGTTCIEPNVSQLLPETRVPFRTIDDQRQDQALKTLEALNLRKN